MKKYIPIITLSAAVIGISYACNSTDLDITNPNAISSDDFPGNAAEVEAGANAIYSPLQSMGLYGRYIPYMFDNMAGENVGRSALSGDLRNFINYTFTSTNNDIYLYWKNAYNGIHRANLMIDSKAKIDAIDGLTTAEKNQYYGEAKFLRAYYYFLLVSRFGDIPLYTTAEVGTEGFAKSSADDVDDLIVADLTEAITLLGAKSAVDEGRATTGAASALLGKVYLYQGNYSLAKAAFDDVIDSGEYSLVDDYFNNFRADTENNDESVFEIRFEDDNGIAWGYQGWDGQDTGYVETSFRSQEYGFNGWHNVNPSDDLVDQFETGDPRIAATFYFAGDTYGVSGNTVTQTNIGDEETAWRKYQVTYRQDSETPFSDINHRAIRYADILLMAAEAENELGNLSTAISLLNQVRDRVSMANYGTTVMNSTYPVTTKAEVFAAIVHERQVELAGEQTRFPDLVRWGMASSELSQYGFVSGKHELFPIPQNEIDTNQNMSSADQNPGY